MLLQTTMNKWHECVPKSNTIGISSSSLFFLIPRSTLKIDTRRFLEMPRGNSYHSSMHPIGVPRPFGMAEHWVVHVALAAKFPLHLHEDDQLVA
jgi:hypothetical protein